PAFRIMLLLAATVGLPFLLLSASTPLLQAWYAAERPGRVPYRLLALSNSGSMLALLSYPFIIEPVFSTHHQALFWSGAYGMAAILCGTIALRARRNAGPVLSGACDNRQLPSERAEVRIDSFSATARQVSLTAHEGSML